MGESRGERRLTIFAIPKAFEGHNGVIQRNAVRSWARLGLPIILLGDDPGVGQMAAEVGAAFVPEVARNDLGTPLLDSAFRIARERAGTPLIGYVNSDIMLFQDLPRTLAGLRLGSFLAVGRRTNLDCQEELDFAAAGLEETVRGRVAAGGVMADEWAIDYFLIPRGSPLTELPPFAVGRPHWDNWMIAQALKLRVPVVDLTGRVLAVHQNHGYGHVKQQRGEKWGGPEADANRALMGGQEGSIARATWFADASGRVYRDDRKLSHIEFEAGYALRFKDRPRAARHYLRAMRYRFHFRQALALAKLLVPRALAGKRGDAAG